MADLPIEGKISNSQRTLCLRGEIDSMLEVQSFKNMAFQGKENTMKTFIKILVLLIAVFQINNVIAADSITGTWHGNLVISPDTELTIEFIITQEPNGSYSAVVNSPGGSGIKDIKADSVVFNAGVLKMDVTELSGSYEGTLKDGKIDGKWNQEGTSLPLNLSPYVKTALSKKDMDKLMGTWHGKIVLPEGATVVGELPTFVFRFETSKNGEFVGFVDLPDYGTKDIPISDMGIVDGCFICEIPNFQSEFKGKLSDNEIVGEFKNKSVANAPTESLTLVKGEYKAQVYKLTLPKEITDQLLGEWNGQLTIKAQQTITLTMVFRFEMKANGDFMGFIDSPDQGATGIPITEASLSDGKLILKIKSLSGEFKGELSKDKIAGDWTQAGNSTPLTLNKGAYKAPEYKLSLPKETMDQLAGKWTGEMEAWDKKSAPNKLVFRFEKAKNGDFKGFVDMPAQDQNGMPVTEASFSNGKLTLKIKAAMTVEFKGQLSGDKIVGEWKANEDTTPLTLTKEKQ